MEQENGKMKHQLYAVIPQKVVLDSFPAPPEVIQNLLTNNTVPAKLFRENSRSFNNALALSSIKVNERKFNNGYNPSVIFEGKFCQA